MDRRLTMNFSALSLFQAMQSRIKDKKPSQLKSLVSSEAWTTMSTTVASVMFAWAIVCQYSPHEVRHLVSKLKRLIRDYLDREVTITFHEACAERFKRGEAYAVVEAYLASIATSDSKRLRAEMESPDSELLLSMAERQEINDIFLGVKFVWTMRRIPESDDTPFHERGQRFYVVRFHQRHRGMATGEYLKHVVRGGKEARAEKRGRKLYTNVAGGVSKPMGMGSSRWSHVAFEHPARLENMALEPAVRDDIAEDLLGFATNREFYERAGKAWKRGYLLHGPPGTGKSTMVAAMANLLNYDVYDLELTSVRDNTELRQLLIDTASKSIVVVEDIDCSLNLTAQRAKKLENKSEGEEKKNESRVTLSGLLNVIDGIWSACGGERVIVFTTNHVEKLDPALIRSGRMDKHIELSYCTFEGFRVLSKNYLGVESHDMFDVIEGLFREVEMTPADVGESLLPRSPRDPPERCLSNLIRALEKAKELARDKKIADGEAEELKNGV